MMKKISLRTFSFLLPFILSLFFYQSYAQIFSSQANMMKHGITVLKQDKSGITLQISVNEYSISEFEINGEITHKITMPGSLLPNDEGAPDLPGLSSYFAMPDDVNPTFQIISKEDTSFIVENVTPAPRDPLVTSPEPVQYLKDSRIYNTNSFYPSNPIVISDPTEVRGIRASVFGVTPFQYNPVTEELRLIKNMLVRIDFSENSGKYGDAKYRSRFWEPILRDMFINYSSINQPSLKAKRTIKSTETEAGYEYVIICPANTSFMAWADTIRRWRTLQGISTGVFTISDVGGNTTTAIEAFINNAYTTWNTPPSAILILADYGSGATEITSPVYNSYCISDNIYGDVNSDHLPDIAMARITARNSSELSTMIGKMMDYERNPPTNSTYYQNPLIAGGWQSDRWFILCTEIIHGFMTNSLNKLPVRQYDGTSSAPSSWSSNTNTSMVVNYFGPSGLGYIPSSPSYLTNWNGNAAGINASINAGTFVVQHRDHGNVTIWGDPYYSVSNVSSLTNNDLPYIFSINCLTGQFDNSTECLAEAFHRSSNGALGVLAATESSYSFVNDAFVWGIYDNMWPSFDPGYGQSGDHNMLPCFASTSGKYYLQASSFPYNSSSKTVTYHLFHHHGGAFSRVYTEMPQTLAVTHSPSWITGYTQFTFTATQGAFVCLTHNEQIIATATATGQSQNVTIPNLNPGEEILLTATKQNYYRHESTVNIVPAAGTYLIPDIVLDDLFGNQNGIAEFDELFFLDISLLNVGTDSAFQCNAVLRGNEQYFTIFDSTETFGDLGQSEQSFVNNAFAVYLHQNIPDEYLVELTLEISEPDTVWEFPIDIEVYAPKIVVTSYIINDTYGNNNGEMEPGESGNIQFYIENQGHMPLVNISTTLNTNSADLSIVPPLQSIAGLTIGQAVSIQFPWQVSSTAQVPASIQCNLDFVAGNYTTDYEFFEFLGHQIEDWESGTFNNLPWSMNGNSDWTLFGNAYEGNYCAKSGVIGHSQTSSLSVSMYVLSADTLSFYQKTSSELNSDFLEFYIDGIQQSHLSGNTSWQYFNMNIQAGYHTFEWNYVKDAAGSAYDDGAYLDYIEFPMFAIPDYDIAVEEIISPVSGANLTANENLTVRISNKGNLAVSNFLMTYIFNNNQVNTEYCTQSVLPGESIDFTFTDQLDLSSLGYYNIKVFSTIQSDTTNFNDTVSQYINNGLPVYCTPVSDCSYGDYIKYFKLENIDHITACSPGGYGDYTFLTTELLQGGTYQLQASTAFSNQVISIWVDFNNNYSFETNENIINNFVLNTSNTIYSTNVTIPIYAQTGLHRMRARISYSIPAPNACISMNYGETQDYMINIIDPNAALEVELGSNFSICEGDTNEISAVVSGGMPPYIYTWSNGETGSVINYIATVSQQLFVSVTDALSNSATDYLYVFTVPKPTVNLGGNQTANFGETVVLNAGVGFQSYLWNTGASTQQISVTQSGNYSVTVSNTAGCSSSDEVSVIFNMATSPNWWYANTGINHTVFFPQSATITVAGNPIESGDYIGVFYDSLGQLACAGYMIYTGSTSTLAAWGEDIGEDGFATGEEFSWKIWDASSQLTYPALAEYNTYLFPDSGNFVANGMSGIASLTGEIPNWNYSITSTNHIIMIPETVIFDLEGINNLSAGSMIGVFFDSLGIEKCGGYVVWNGQTTTLAAWGEDVGNDGFIAGEEFKWKIWNSTNNTIYDIEAEYNNIIFPNTGDFLVNGLSGVSKLSAITGETQSIVLNNGWNMFSTYMLVPYPGIDSVLSPVEANVIIAKNYLGLVYWPMWNINNIGNLVIEQGYSIKMNIADTLNIFATPIQPELHTFVMPTGWSMIAYLRKNQMPIDQVFSGISNILIVKDENGLVYWPMFNVNNIGDMKAGEGYLIKMIASGIFTYPAN